MLHRLKDHQPRLAIIAAMLLIALTGIVHGLWTHRWGANETLMRATQRLKQADFNFEGWQGEDLELDPQKLKLAGIAGYRRWFGQETATGSTASLLVLCGDHGPISVHTPQYCYAGVGYKMVGEEARYRIQLPNEKEAIFWTARFHKPDAPEEPPLRIFWGWNDGTGWKAPTSPRKTFSGALFKLYAVREMNSLKDPLETDPCLMLLRQALPRLDAQLF